MMIIFYQCYVEKTNIQTQDSIKDRKLVSVIQPSPLLFDSLLFFVFFLYTLPFQGLFLNFHKNFVFLQCAENKKIVLKKSYFMLPSNQCKTVCFIYFFITCLFWSTKVIYTYISGLIC